MLNPKVKANTATCVTKDRIIESSCPLLRSKPEIIRKLMLRKESIRNSKKAITILSAMNFLELLAWLLNTFKHSMQYTYTRYDDKTNDGMAKNNIAFFSKNSKSMGL